MIRQPTWSPFSLSSQSVLSSESSQKQIAVAQCRPQYLEPLAGVFWQPKTCSITLIYFPAIEKHYISVFSFTLPQHPKIINYFTKSTINYIKTPSQEMTVT